MEFGVVSVILLVFAAVMVMLGLKLLFKNNWFLQFLRGFAGFGLLLMAYFTIMSGLNVASYSKLVEGEPIANISFKKLGEQSFEATVVNVVTGEEKTFEVDGDLWQMDARIMRLAMSGPTPYYKLDRLSGRYYSIEQESTSSKSVHSLATNSIGFDLWAMFKGSSLGLVTADYGSATYMPMADGALYSVAVGVSGLQAKAVNEAAQAVISGWK